MDQIYEVYRQTIGKHLFINELGHVSESNPTGSVRMVNLTKEIIERFEDIEEPITFVLRGMPYADFDMYYQIQLVENDPKYNSGWLIGLVMYPAGFMIRHEDMLRNKEDFIAEIRVKLTELMKKEKEENAS